MNEKSKLEKLLRQADIYSGISVVCVISAVFFYIVAILHYGVLSGIVKLVFVILFGAGVLFCIMFMGMVPLIRHAIMESRRERKNNG